MSLNSAAKESYTVSGDITLLSAGFMRVCVSVCCVVHLFLLCLELNFFPSEQLPFRAQLIPTPLGQEKMTFKYEI